MALLGFLVYPHPEGVEIELTESSELLALLAPSPAIIGRKQVFANITMEQMEQGVQAAKTGSLVQDAFSFLSPSQREFLMSGLTDAEFQATAF